MTLKDTPSSAKKSAVIISQDGEIEQHIPREDNLEDVIEGTFEPVEENLPPTVNQVVYVNESEQEPIEPQPVAKQKINIKLVMVPVAMLLLMLPLYFLFSPSDGSDLNEEIDSNAEPVPTDIAVVSRVEKIELHPQSISRLKKLATVVLDDNQQLTSNIDLFVDNWNLMDDFSKQDFSNSFWMRRYRALLTQKIDTFESNGENYSADHTINYRNSLINLAAIISSLKVVDDTSSEESDVQFEELFEKISSELAMAELDKQLADEQRATADNTDTLELGTEIIDKSAQFAVSTAEETPNSVKTIKTSTKGFTESDLNYLLGQYSTIYEFGNTKKIMKLFSARRAYKRALKKNFDKVFDYSSDRSIRFSDFNWQFFNNSIVGHGKYKAKITLKQHKGVRHVNADIRVKFRAEKDRLRIARMNFSKVKVRLIKPKSSDRTPVDFGKRKTKQNASLSGKTTKLPKANSLLSALKSNRKMGNRRLKIPTAAELQDIVTRFISAYESGNINALDQIFSTDAKTNDQNGLSEIKKDYRTLFQSTTDRQLFIQDIKWTIVNNYARGKGILNILIVADGSNAIDSQQGEIQITAQKNKDKLLITHLFHDLRN